ncbi:chorismate mutase [Lactococcus hircilactis]|uniref:Chorismate mutase n=2 Tax=Lactococcus hircilactis TaxID=1494462 RepID=A0A7X1Z747_9LACT|nr:chorismate mutase [Lactococcus hircilactis]
MKSKNLAEVRENIDRIDRELVKLLGERAVFVGEAAAFKTDTASVQAPQRVEAVIAKVRALAEENQTDPALIEKIYRAMISAFTEAEQAEFETNNF